jgi:hypothetical protein
MISTKQTFRFAWILTALSALVACGESPGATDSENAIIDPPAQCQPDRPDCSRSFDFPGASELTAENSAGLRYSDATGGLIIDRGSSLPDADGDGVPDDADDCPGTPDWISCDGDPTNDGIYQTLFYDPSGADEVVRSSIATTTAAIPSIDVYFLIDATPTLAEEIASLQDDILNIIDDIRGSFPDAQFGLGLYREYALEDLALPFSQAPYHHVLDLTDDEALIQTAVSTLNTVAHEPGASAATQALYSVASGLGLGNAVPNRGSCPNAPDADIGYPCFRRDALHVVMNITDAAVYNGPNPLGAQYTDPPFAPGVGVGGTQLPPVQMFPALFAADDASLALALDLGDHSGTSLTLMGMSTLLSDQVNTAIAPGCAPPPPVPPAIPPGADMDGKDVVLALSFGPGVTSFSARAVNTHWPGANLALFDSAALDPPAALACDNGPGGSDHWGAIAWAPTPSQQYYLVADGIIPANEPGHMPEGAFSISIIHDGDPANASWMTSDAPAIWSDVETALLASDIRVASVVTLKDPMTMPSDGNADARLIATATDASTKAGGQWVTELASTNGEGLYSAVSNTIALARTESVYTFSVTELDDPASAVDERELVIDVRNHDCGQSAPLGCALGTGNSCDRCDLDAVLEYEVVFANASVPPNGASQLFNFELLVQAEGSIEVERIPVRVMVPNSAAHDFDELPGANFYRNVYESTLRCNTPPERPTWGDLIWSGSTPPGSSIEFQIRTANTAAELASAIPAIVIVDENTMSDKFNIRDELVADGLPYGLLYLQVTAILNPSNSPPTTPVLDGWSFEFFCQAAE